jgi:excisionase family DNA binding protein
MANARKDIDPGKCLTYLVPEAGEMLGLTRNASYAAAKRGDIPTIRFGKLIRVPKAAFDKLLEQAGAK